MMWPFRRRLDWTVLDWHRFVLAGGVLTVDAWERATPASRAALLLYRAGGAEDSAEPQAAPPEPERVEPARSLTDELRAMGAALGRPAVTQGGQGGRPPKSGQDRPERIPAPIDVTPWERPGVLQ